jgi:ATP adenylyltransferase
MDHLWSPWRYSYINKASSRTGCIFCEKSADPEKDDENFLIHRGTKNFVLLNIYPYASGHVMIAPYQHVATLEEADEDVLAEMMLLTRATESHLRRIYSAPGFNIGMNLGASAGAGVAGHIHMHSLPRWPGDVNFMTSIAETRVLPEDLRTSFEKLRRAFRDE